MYRLRLVFLLIGVRGGVAEGWLELLRAISWAKNQHFQECQRNSRESQGIPRCFFRKSANFQEFQIHSWNSHKFNVVLIFIRVEKVTQLARSKNDENRHKSVAGAQKMLKKRARPPTPLPPSLRQLGSGIPNSRSMSRETIDMNSD